MSRWVHTMLQALAFAALPFIVDAGSAPTVFAPDNATALRDQGQALGDQAVDIETARRIALVVVDDVSRRADGTLEQIHADQALVLDLAERTGNDPEILAIHANLLGVEAGIEENLIRRLTLAKTSSLTLDKLVREHPDIGGTFMQRGLNALHSTLIARRIQIAIDDCERLFCR